MYPLLPRLSKRRVQAAASVMVMVAVLLSSLGIVVIPNATQDTSVAFPCMGGTCGCSSAAQCWQSCCCNTPVERLAWAQANNIEPPESLLRMLALTEMKSPDSKAACCSQLAGDTDCVAEIDATEQATGRVVLMSAINKCRGLGGYIAIFGAAICEPLPVNDIGRATASERIAMLDVRFASLTTAPPTPPPRVFG